MKNCLKTLLSYALATVSGLCRAAVRGPCHYSDERAG